ncbi:hypothetical protein GF336_01560 [Candidatus Woesearchaeota archaeon]|nr:hypothetical protein [Candidatus Woesearchaeota archaeon]
MKKIAFIDSHVPGAKTEELYDQRRLKQDEDVIDKLEKLGAGWRRYWQIMMPRISRRGYWISGKGQGGKNGKKS